MAPPRALIYESVRLLFDVSEGKAWCISARRPSRPLQFSNPQMEVAFGGRKKITEGRNRIRPSAGVRTACPDFHPSRMAAARAWGTNLVAYFLQDSLTIFRSVTKSMLPPPACPPA